MFCFEVRERRALRYGATDRECALVTGDHFHRQCRCGHRWVERGAEEFPDQ